MPRSLKGVVKGIRRGDVLPESPTPCSPPWGPLSCRSLATGDGHSLSTVLSFLGPQAAEVSAPFTCLSQPRSDGPRPAPSLSLGFQGSMGNSGWWLFCPSLWGSAGHLASLLSPPRGCRLQASLFLRLGLFHGDTR